MSKRKANQDSSVDDSDLSPPPNNLDEGAAALVNANAELQPEDPPTKKRKTAGKAVKSETVANAPLGTAPSPSKRISRARKVKVEPEEEEAASTSEEAPKPTPKKRQSKAKAVKKEEVEEDDGAETLSKGRSRKKPEAKEEVNKGDNDEKTAGKPAKKKRKTKEEKEAEAMPLAARTVGHKLFIGAHVSSAGGQCHRVKVYNIHIQRHTLQASISHSADNSPHRRTKRAAEQRPHWC